MGSLSCAHVDSAVSKTVNCDGTMPWGDFKGIYLEAYRRGAKGCTTFNKDGKRAGLFKETHEASDLPFPDMGAGELSSQQQQDESIYAAESMSCEFDPATGRRSCE